MVPPGDELVAATVVRALQKQLPGNDHRIAGGIGAAVVEVLGGHDVVGVARKYEGLCGERGDIAGLSSDTLEEEIASGQVRASSGARRGKLRGWSAVGVFGAR